MPRHPGGPRRGVPYTARGNLVAVVSNGTAVLGLGNIGAAGGQARDGGQGGAVQAIRRHRRVRHRTGHEGPGEIIRTCQLLEPTFGGINLEDIKAPECFEIEETLKRTMNIPVFHDDQHGTAIISGAALMNALELVGKKIADVRIVFSGAGASAIAMRAISTSQLGARRENIMMCDSKGVIYEGRTEGMNKYKAEFAAPHRSAHAGRRHARARTCSSACRAAGCVTPEMVEGDGAEPGHLRAGQPRPGDHATRTQRRRGPTRSWPRGARTTRTR